MYEINIHDNLIPDALRKEVWKYIQNQTWYATWKATVPTPHVIHTYVPSVDKERGWALTVPPRNPTQWMHRTCFASDEHGLEQNHPVIWELWKAINNSLGNQYSITGTPEEMSLPETHEWKSWEAPATQDPNLEQGWRVYTNGQPNESIKRSHGIHRDTINLSDQDTCTLLYVANLEWYPSWFAECVFYDNDPEGEVGDHQQYQKQVAHTQGRDFNMGWADKVVSPKPGRIIVYDGRTLHTTRPSAVWANDLRKVVAFRVRKNK